MEGIPSFPLCWEQWGHRTRNNTQRGTKCHLLSLSEGMDLGWRQQGSSLRNRCFRAFLAWPGGLPAKKGQLPTRRRVNTSQHRSLPPLPGPWLPAATEVVWIMHALLHSCRKADPAQAQHIQQGLRPLSTILVPSAKNHSENGKEAMAEDEAKDCTWVLMYIIVPKKLPAPLDGWDRTFESGISAVWTQTWCDNVSHQVIQDSRVRVQFLEENGIWWARGCKSGTWGVLVQILGVQPWLGGEGISFQNGPVRLLSSHMPCKLREQDYKAELPKLGCDMQVQPTL